MANTQVYKAQLTFEQKGLENATKLLKGLSVAAKEATASLKGISSTSNPLQQVATKIQTIGQKQVEASEKTTAAVKKQQAAVNNAVDTTKLDAMVQRFHAVKNAGESTAVGLSDRFRGLQLAIGTSGARMQGFREIISGTAASNNALIKGFDWVIGRTDKLGRLNSELGRSMVEIGQHTDRLVRSMNSQVDAMKKVASAEGLGTDVAEEFDKSLTRVDSAFKQVITTARSGGDVGKALVRAKTEVEGLEFEYQSLIRSGIIPADSETAKLFRDMVQEARNGSTNLQALSSRYTGLKDKITQTKAAQDRAAASGDKQANVFKRISINIGNMFNIFRSGNSTINQTTQALDNVGDKMSMVSRTANVAKAAFMGAFGGAVILPLLYQFQDVLRGIGREFFELNDLIQNTNITLAGMLEGSQVNAEAAIAGFTAFVEEQVAKTPFEFSDAIAASLRLVQQGFDPQEWFTPAANAAAAMNKPMEQFIGGMVKLVGGAKGMAVDMFRDFGLNVNNIKGLVKDANGEMVEMSWQFNKQGSLVNDTGEALAILNAYLSQNATFAKAAASRSESLSGIISNMKDAFSKLLIAIGQPIFDKLTVSAGGLLTKIDAIMPIATQMATGLGNTLAGAIDFVFNLFSSLNNILSSTQETFGGFINAISSAIHGDWSSAWAYLLEAVADSLDGVFSFLDDFISNAFDWGASFVSQIANGVIGAANSILMEAINYVGEMISSFMEPGSPPKEGPLSSIDKWGMGLMAAFGDGMKSADVSFLNEALGPIADRFEKFADEEEGLIPFKNIKKNLIALSGEISRTGEINAAVFAKIKTQILGAGEGEKEVEKSLVAQLEARLKLQAAQSKALKLQEKKAALEKEYQQKIAEAEATGYIDASLLKERDDALSAIDDQIAAQEDQSGQYEDQIKLQDELTKLRELDNKVFNESEDNADKAMKADAGMLGSAMKTAKKIKKTWQETYADNLSALEEKYNLGVISEEDYLKQLLRLEEKWVDDALKSGVTAGLDEHVAKIQQIKARIEEIKPTKASKDAIKNMYKPPSVEEIMANFIKDVPDKIEEVATKGGQKFVAAIKTEVKSGIGETIATIKDKLAGGFGEIAQTLGEKIKQFVTPQNLPVIAGIVGLFTTLAGPSVLGGLSSLVGIFVTFGGTIARLVLMFGKLSVIGLVITAIILNWDKIVAAATAAWQWMNDVFDDFIQRVGGIEKAKELFNKLVYSVKNAANTIGLTLRDALYAVITDFDFSSAWNSIKTGFSSIDWAGLMTGAGSLLKPLFDAILTGIQNLGQQLLNLLPPQVVANIDNATQSLKGFFAEGRLGGELVRLFKEIGSVLQTMWPAIKIFLIAVGIAIGLVIDVIASLLVAILDALPFIERALAGIVRFVTGVIEVFEGMMLLFKAGWQAITGDTEGASQTVQQALGKLQMGIADIFKGIYQTIINVFFAIGQAAISFVATFIGNILAFIPGMENAAAAFYDFKNVILDALITLSDELQTTLYAAVDQAIVILIGLVDQVITIVSTLYDRLPGPMQDIITALVNPFQAVYNLIVGNSIIPDLVNEILKWISTLPAKLIEKGKEIAGGLINGIKGGLNIVGGIGSLFSGLFGGDEGGGGESTSQFAQILGDGQTLKDGMSTIFGEIGNMWSALMTSMTAMYTTHISGLIAIDTNYVEVITELYTNFSLFYNQLLLMLNLRWQMFVRMLVSAWISAMNTIISYFQKFFFTVITGLQGIIDKFDEMIEKVIEAAEAVVQAGDDMADAFIDAADEIGDAFADIIEKLEDAKNKIDNVTIAFGKMAAAAREAAMASSDAADKAGRAGIEAPEAQGGAWNTWEGMWYLHKKEMVLPAGIADKMRGLLQSIKTIGIHGGIGFGNLVPVGGGIANRGNLDLAGAGAGGGEFPIQVNNYITDEKDLRMAERRTTSAVKGAIKGRFRG